jgi:4-hydroxy-tetrahydrodipicolinate synthase
MENKPLQLNELQGTFPALITPMYAGDCLSNPIDYDKMFKLIDQQSREGIQGVLIAGTTGQSATLSHDEHIKLVKKTHDYISRNHTQLKFIAGAGSNCTREAISLSKSIEQAVGPTTFLHVTGYYNNPPQKGLISHFKAISKNIKGNMILYNVPGRTKSNLQPDSVAELSEIENIIGLKEASGNLEQVAEIIKKTTPENFRVLSGEDHQVAEIMKLGGYGVISASANIAPKYFVKITKAALDNEYQQAEKLQKEINPLVKQGVFLVKNPIPLAHIFNTNLRLPLVKIPSIQQKLEDVLSKYKPEDLGINLEQYENK